MAFPLMPNQKSSSQNLQPQPVEVPHLRNDSRFLQITNRLITALQKHEQYLKQGFQAKNISQSPELQEIYEDCLRIHELCLEILSKNFQLIESKHLILLKNHLLSIEHELEKNKENKMLKEIKIEIEELEKAIDWTKQISDQKVRFTSQSKTSFWKTFLKVAVFSGLIGKADTPSLQHPLSNVQKYELLQPKLSEGIFNISQVGMQCFTPSSTEIPLSIEQEFTSPIHEYFLSKEIYSLMEIQDLNKFISNYSIPINNQLLFHLVGDFGEGTGLEGGNTVRNLEYLHNIFDQELYHLDQTPPSNERQGKFFQAFFEGMKAEGGISFSKETLEKLREQVKRAFVIGKSISMGFSEFYHAAITQIKTLAVDDSFFFPFNWPKHALACEIIKEGEDSYVVRFYNTGEGSESYSEIYTPEGLKRLPFIEVIGVTLKNLENFAFYNGLWKLANSDVVDKPQKKLSDQILPSLKGFPSNREYSAEEHLTPQRSGTCSMKVLSGVLCQIIGDTQKCHLLNWKLNLKALSNFHQQHEQVLNSDIISRNNLRKGLTEFSVLSQNLLKKDMISSKAFHYASDLIKEISNTLDASELSYESIQQMMRVRNATTAAPALLPSMPYLRYYGDDEWKPFTIPPPLTFERPSFLIPSFTINNFVNELQTVLTELDIQLKKIYLREKIIYCYELSMQTIHDLPFPTDNFWTSLPIDHIPEAIEKLTDLEFSLAFSVRDYAALGSDYFTPSGAIVNVMKLIAIMNALGERAFDKTLPPINLYQKTFEEIFENKNPWLSALSPQAIEQLKNIKDYWIKRKPQEAENQNYVSIFGIEAAPPGFVKDSYYREAGIELFADNQEIRRNHGKEVGTNFWDEPILKYYDWGFQKWAEEYLDTHPEIHKKLQKTLRAQFPERSKLFDNLKTTAIFSLADIVKYDVGTEARNQAIKVLPNIFYKLRDASFIADVFFRGNLGNDRDRKKYLTWTLSESNQEGEINKYNLKFSSELYNSGYAEEISDSTWSGAARGIIRSSPSGLSSPRRPLPKNDREIDNIWSKGGKQRFRLLPEEIRSKHPSELGLREETIEKYGIERTRNFLTLSSIKELQVFRTLSYFSQNSYLLDTADGQWLFERLMFEPLILREQLMKEESQVRLLLDSFQAFIKQQYQSISMNDSKVIFLIRCHRRFQQEVENVHANHPKYISKEMQQVISNVRIKISNLLKSTPVTSALRTALNQELAISFSHINNWNEKLIIQFLTAHVTAKSLFKEGLADKLSNWEQEEAISLQLHNLIPFFKEGDSLNSILNRVLKNIIPNMPELVTWEPYNSFPVFMGTAAGADVKHYLNLRSGEISDSTGLVSVSPPYTYSTIVKLKEKFPDTEFTAVSQFQWSFTPAKHEYRIHAVWGGEPIIQKKIFNEWYQLNQDNLFSIPVDLIRNTNLWFSIQNEQSKIIFENIVDDKPVAYGFNTSNDKLKIYKANEAGGITDWIYEDISDPASQMHFLIDIESGLETILWRNETSGAPEELHLPRFGLQFKAQERNGEFVFISDELGGYEIAKDQHVDALADARHYLVLEKGTEKAILIPRVPYGSMTSDDSSLNPISRFLFEPSKPIKSWESNRRYFIYQVQPSRSQSGSIQTKIVSPSREARFFLSMIHLWHHNYEEALQYLVEYGGQQKQYEVEEREILKWISQLNQGNKDATPEANAVRLHARILLMRNERNYGFKKKNSNELSLFKDDNFFKESVLAYEKYLIHLSTWGQFQLKKDDEHFFLRELLSFFPKNRFNDLLQGVFNPAILDSLYKSLQRRLEEIKGKEPSLSNVSIKPNPAAPTQIAVGKTSAEAIFTDLRYNRNRAASSNILKPTFNEFDAFYQAVRTHDPSLMKEMLQKITGVEVNFVGIDELTEALDQVLEFISFDSHLYGRWGEGEQVAIFLRNVLHYPTSAISDLPEKLDIHNAHSFLKEEISKILELTSKYEPAYSMSKRPLHPQSRKTKVKAKRTSPMIQMETKPVYVLTIPKLPDLLEFHINAATAHNLMALNSPESLNATRAELANDINIKTNNTVANRVIKRLHEDISSYEGPAKAQSYSITDWPALQNLYKSVAQEYASASATLDQLEYQIETLIQKAPEEATARDLLGVEIAIKRKRPLNIDDAIYLYLRRSSETFQELNPALNEADQNEFLALMHRYLIEKTNQQHRSRILEGINVIDEIQSKQGLEAVPQKLKDNLGRVLFNKRAYDPGLHPEYLVLEHFMDIILWDKQVKALDTLLIKDGKITAQENIGSALELIMGSGKTDVLLPLICLLNADGKNLAMGVVVRGLLTENAAELYQRVGPAFRQVLDVISINQDTRLNLEGLINLLDNLNYAIENRRFVMTSDSDIQGLFLKFGDANIDAFHAQGEEKLEKLTEISQFRKIFQLLHTSGVPVFDEADTTFNAKLSQHQTRGDPLPLPDSFTEGTRAFMLALGEQALQKNPFQEEEELANHIAGVIIQENRGAPFEKNSLMFNYLNGLNLKEKQIIADFFKGSNDPLVLKFIDDLSKQFRNPLAKQKDSSGLGLTKGEMIQDILSVIRGQISSIQEKSSLASLIFSKKYLFDFAPSVPEEEVDQVEKVQDLLSIPHKKGIPSIGSKPGTELEEILYTYRQFLLRQRLPKTFFKNVVEDLRTKTISESSSMYGKLEDIPAYKELILIFGDKLPESLKYPFDDKLIEASLAAHAENSVRLTNFIDKYIIKKIEFFPYQINSNAQFYRFLFKKGSETAFSGTICNGESWPWLFGEDLHLSDTAQKTLTLIYQGPNKTVHSINIAEAETVADALHEIYSQIPEGTSIIDATENLLKFDPKEVAIGMLAQSNLSNKTAVRYPDKHTGLWMEIERGKKEPTLVDLSKLSPQEVAVFWPSPKTTGSDVRTAPDEVTVAIFGPNTLLRDIQQSLWRQREYDKGQSARFVMDSGDKAIISKTLGEITGEPLGGEFQIKHVLQNAAYKHALQVGDDNTRSLKLRLGAALMHRVWEKVLDPAASDEDVVEIMHQAAPLYLTKGVIRPYEIYGKPAVLRSKKDVAEEWVNTTIKTPIFETFKKSEQEDIIKEMKRISRKALPTLPSHIVATQHYGLEREVQVQTQKETHKETQTQIETETETNLGIEKDFFEPIPNDWKEQLFVWKDTGVFKKSYFSNIISTKTNLWEIKSDSQPIVSLDTFVNITAQPEEFIPTYSSKVFSSLNQSPINRHPHSLAAPHSRVQEYPRVFLVIQSQTDPADLRSLLITEREEQRFRELLDRDQQKPSTDKRELKIALYDLVTGVTAESSEPIDISSLEKNPEFLMQKVQLKFYAGMSQYSKEEIHFLSDWIKSCGVENMKNYFKSIILKGRSDSQHAFEYSTLYNLFKELSN